MAKQTASFVDQHIEKVVLGVCAAALIGIAAYHFTGAPYKVEEDEPSKVCDSAREAAQRTLDSLSRPPAKSSAPDANLTAQLDTVLKNLEQWIGKNAKGLVELAKLVNPWPRVEPFPPVLVKVGDIDEADRIELAKFVAPGTPVVTTGRMTFDIPKRVPITELIRRGVGDKAETAARHWVSVAAQVDLFDMATSFRTANYPPGEATTLPICRVHLQRRDVTDGNGPWQDIDAYLPFLPLERPRIDRPADTANKGVSISMFADWIREARDFIIRPPLPAKAENARGDVVMPPLPFLGEESADAGTPGDIREKARLWRSRADKLRKGKDIDLEGAYMLAYAAANAKGLSEKDREPAATMLKEIERELKSKGLTPPTLVHEPEYLMPIMAHDLTAQAGRLYQYRICYEVLNAWAGNSARLKNPQDAQRLTLMSGWSPPSRKVEIKSDTYIYLTKANPKNNEVTVRVFKQSGGAWVNRDYKVQVGEMVGKRERGGGKRGEANFSTGLMCLDIDFDYVGPNGKKDVMAVFVDTQDGSLVPRLLARDQSDPKIKQLEQLASAGR